MRVRDIREIKREARAEMNKSSRGVQGYPIAPLDLTSRYIRPHSSTAHLISQICSEEKLKATRLAHQLRSKSLNADHGALKGSKSIPGRKNPAGAYISFDSYLFFGFYSDSLFILIQRPRVPKRIYPTEVRLSFEWRKQNLVPTTISFNEDTVAAAVVAPTPGEVIVLSQAACSEVPFDQISRIQV